MQSVQHGGRGADLAWASQRAAGPGVHMLTCGLQRTEARGEVGCSGARQRCHLRVLRRPSFSKCPSWAPGPASQEVTRCNGRGGQRKEVEGMGGLYPGRAEDLQAPTVGAPMSMKELWGPTVLGSLWPSLEGRCFPLCQWGRGHSKARTVGSLWT